MKRNLINTKADQQNVPVRMIWRKGIRRASQQLYDISALLRGIQTDDEKLREHGEDIPVD